MKLTKLDNESILIKPETALDHNFLFYLAELIEAREAMIHKELKAIASNYESPSQDSQPLIIGPQP